jgi:histidinol-phosphate aminotransferase
MNKIEQWVRPNIRNLSPYSTARDEAKGRPDVFLDANECPYEGLGYNRYPDPRQKVLKARVSALKGLPAENIFLGNGSDEAIDLMYRIFCTPGKDNAVAIVPSYGMYAVAADINDVQVRGIPLGPDFSLPASQLLAAADANTRLLFLCSPNNPSGNAFPNEELLSLVEQFPGVVVLDEAYADFSAFGSLRSKVQEYPNLVVLQTFSKAYGLAGLRLGMAFADAYVIELMNRVKYPYNISQATQELALKALEEPRESLIRQLIAQRRRLTEALLAYSSILKVWPSDANFLLVQVKDADGLYNHLLKDGIIVRNRSRVPGCAGCLRFTIGTPEENDRLLLSLADYEKSHLR